MLRVSSETGESSERSRSKSLIILLAVHFFYKSWIQEEDEIRPRNSSINSLRLRLRFPFVQIKEKKNTESKVENEGTIRGPEVGPVFPLHATR